MSSSLTNALVQCSIATASGAETHFPAKLQPSSSSTVKFRPDRPDDHASSAVSSRSSRRGLICIAPLPCLLLPLTQIIGCLRANATTQPGTQEYVRIKEEVRNVLSKGKAAGVLRLVFHDAGTFEFDDNTERKRRTRSIQGQNENRDDEAGRKQRRRGRTKTFRQGRTKTEMKTDTIPRDGGAVCDGGGCNLKEEKKETNLKESQTISFPIFKGGMNGSIIYELERPENAGLKKSVKVLQKAKTQIDAIQPVSWADVIAVAGAEAVEICGGPTIQVSLGRQDSLGPDPEGKLPEESLDASGLKKCFQRKGFSTQELVALSGAHTLGSKGFGSPTSFDNSYYKVLLEKPWTSSGGMPSMIGLPSDHALVEDDECLRWIIKYADNENMFFEDFKNAYVKLVNTGVKWNGL